MSLHLFAGLRVRDFQAARPWYERLLGEPTFFPHATEAVWTLAEDRSVYVVEHADGAGNSVVTIFLDDLDAHVAAIAARGLEPDERETYSNGVRKVLYRDPDGNELGFGGAPLDDRFIGLTAEADAIALCLTVQRGHLRAVPHSTSTNRRRSLVQRGRLVAYRQLWR